jgi:hypothetical protein
MLQVIMWVIFGVTMAMAALVTSRHRSAYHVELAPPVQLGPFDVRLPASWKLTGPTRRGPLLVVEVLEPRNEVKAPTQRLLTVFYEPLDEAVKPYVYLLSQPALGYEDSSWFGQGTGTARHPDEFEHTTIAGHPAVLADRIVQKRVMMRVYPPVAEFFAATVVPGKGALTVRFICDPAVSAADRALLRQVLREITLSRN